MNLDWTKINKIFTNTIKIFVLFSISFTLVYFSDILFYKGEAKALIRNAIIATIPFAIFILYSDYISNQKNKK